MTLCPICSKPVLLSGDESISNPQEFDFMPCHFACFIRKSEEETEEVLEDKNLTKI